MPVAKRCAKARDFLFLGRDSQHPVALEGALKLKEISYIHAEGYAAGEMKHGPIALIDENLPVVVLAAKEPHYEKTLGNMEEVQARGGRGHRGGLGGRQRGRQPGRRWRSACRPARRCSRRCSPSCRCSSSPTTWPTCAAPTWTSPATSPRA